MIIKLDNYNSRSLSILNLEGGINCMLNLYDKYCDKYVCVALPCVKISGKVKEICDGFLIIKDRCCRVYAINIDNILYITPLKVNRCKCKCRCKCCCDDYDDFD